MSFQFLFLKKMSKNHPYGSQSLLNPTQGLLKSHLYGYNLLFKNCLSRGNMLRIDTPPRTTSAKDMFLSHTAIHYSVVYLCLSFSLLTVNYHLTEGKLFNVANFSSITRCYAGTSRPQLLLVTVWHYDFVNVELCHDLDLQMILTKLTQLSPEIINEQKLLRNK